MNHDPTTASEHPAAHQIAGISDSNAAVVTVAPGSDAEPVDARKHAQKDLKLFFLNSLTRNVDIMIYCELSVLFYMDCSIFKFIIRAIPHWFYFTPKPDVFPPVKLLQRPHIGTIFSGNLVCMLLHLLLSLPVADESSQGYLHGGLLIDFIGQQSPVSRTRLIGLDFLTLGLQLVMLAVTIEKQRLQGKVTGAPSENATTASALDETAPQDYDAEEQGMLRSDRYSQDDIELRNLQSRSEGRTGGDEDHERDELLDRNGNNESYHAHPLDALYTGEHVIADLHIFDTVRTQWSTKALSVNAASTASRTQIASTMAGRRLTFGSGNRTLAAN